MKNLLYGAIWGGLIVLCLIAPLHHLDSYTLNYDEGPQLQAAALAQNDYALYSEVIVNKPPFLTWILQFSFLVSGTSLVSARLVCLLMTAMGFVALGMLAELWWGKWSGPATMTVLLLIPEATRRASAVMNDLPAMSALLYALLAATLYRKKQKRHWIIVSALAYALAVGLHPFFTFSCIPIVGILLLNPGKKLDVKQAMLQLLTFGSVVIVVALAVVVLVDTPGLFRWVYQYNRSPSNDVGVHREAWPLIAAYLREHWSLLTTAVGGSLLLLALQPNRFWTIQAFVWTAVTLGTLVLMQPLWDHYRILLLYPLTALAGGGLAVGLGWCLAKKNERATWKREWLTVLNGLVGVSMLLIIMQRFENPPTWPQWSNAHRAAQRYLQQHVKPGDFVVSDNEFLAFTSGYLVPPTLADTSRKRISWNFLHFGEMVATIWKHEIDYLVLDSDVGHLHAFPDFMHGIRAISDRLACFDSICVYRVNRSYQPQVALVGDSIRLRGYTLSEGEPLVQAGDTFTVTLYWENTKPISEELVVFVHLLDENENIVAQHDDSPILGYAPVWEWPVESLVPDPHPMTIDINSTPGKYTLATGMYRWPSIERLPARDVTGKPWPHDIVTLTPIVVEAPE